MRPISIRLVALLRASLPVSLAPDDNAPVGWAQLAELADSVCAGRSDSERRIAAREFAARTFAANSSFDGSSGKSVSALYEHASQAVIPDWGPGLETQVEDDGAGGVNLWLRFAKDALDLGSVEPRALDALFEILSAFAEQIPTLVGEPPAEGQLRRWPGEAIATVELPRPARRTDSRADAAGASATPALDHFSDGILEIGNDGRIFEINEAALRRIGLTREFVLSRTLDELVAAKDRPRVLEHIGRAFSSEQPSVVAYGSFDDNGRYLDLEASISPFRRADGTQRAIAVMREITDRVAREKATDARAHRFQTMVEAGQDIAAEICPEGNTLYSHVSIDGFEEIANDDRFASTLFARLDPDSRTTASDGFYAAEQDGSSHHFDVKLRTDAGALRCFTVRMEAVGDREGVAVRMWDITHRKEYEDALRAIAETAFDSGSFLDTLVGHMARSLGVDCALVATSVDAAAPSAHTLALWSDGGLGDELEFEVGGTPFEAVLAGQTSIYPGALPQRFPSPTPLALSNHGAEFEAFLGAPLYDDRGNVAGCIAALSTRPIANLDLARSTLAIFAQRATSELQRAAAAFAQRETEQRLRAILEQTPDLIVDADAENGVQYVSPSIHEILGFEPGEISPEDLLPADEREETLERFRQAYSQTTPVKALVRLRDREGNWRWFDTTGRGYDGKTGERRLVIIARDVTQERLAESERLQLTGLMEQSSDLMTLCSLDGEMLFLNQAGRQLVGAGDEASSASVFDFFAAAHNEKLRDEVLPALSRERTWSGELDLRHLESGEAIPVSASLFILSDERSSRPAALAVICRDLRETYRAAEALSLATDRLAALADSSFDMIAEVDEAGRFIFASSTYETTLGFKPEDLIGTSSMNLIPIAERAATAKLLGDMIIKGESRIGRHTCLDADGNEHPAEATLVGYKSASGKPHALIITRDLTESSEVEQKLQESEERLRQSQKMEAIGRLAGGIAHDFNNLLTAITGHADLLIEDLGKDHPSLSDAREILNASTRASALTRQLLAFSRRQVLQIRTVDLNALVSGIDRMLRRVIGEEYRFVSCLDGSLWPATADESQIEQVLLNLVVNARDAMPVGGEIRVETENVSLAEERSGPHGTVPAGDYASLSVTDSGAGMAAETLERVFEPFFTTKPSGEGTGLGLSTVLGIVQQSGGFVQVESNPGSGSSFQIFLPRADELHIATESVEDTPTAPGNAVVLLLEDEHAVRALVARHLSERGYEVLEASHGEAALEHCRQRADIDLLLTDVVLHGLDGPSVAERVLKMNPRIRVAFMSGFTDDALERHGLDAADIVLLQKPFSRNALLHCVEQALADDNESKSLVAQDSGSSTAD